jgi:two-component system, NarL family, response regulator NreC
VAKYNIVIADDHDMFREGLKNLINRESQFRVVGEAQDGEILLAQLKKLQCDIVVVDLSMPNMDGMTAIKTIRQKHPHIKIMVLTMQKDHEHFKHAMAYGASGYLLKDDAFEQFAKAVKQIMRGKHFVSPAVSTLLADRYIRSLDDSETPSLDILTKREIQILKYVASSLANKNIASKLKISIRTVETHRANLTNKLGIKTTAGLVKFAISKGLV